MDEGDDLTSAYMLTLLAGMSTGIGSMIAFFIPKPKLTYLSVLPGFAAGAMIYISFVELLSISKEAVGFLAANTSFFEGMVVIYLLDRVIGHVHLDTLPDSHQARLRKAGIFTAIEGLPCTTFRKVCQCWYIPELPEYGSGDGGCYSNP